MFLKRSNILRVFQQIKLLTRNFFAIAMDTSFFVCSILEFVGKGGPTANCLLQKCPHQWCSLWFMAYTYSEIFQTNSLVCGFQSNLNNIEIYSYRDLFLQTQHGNKYENHNQKIWAHWRMPMLVYWPKSPLLEKATPNLCGVKKNAKICLSHGIACHINKG